MFRVFSFAKITCLEKITPHWGGGSLKKKPEAVALVSTVESPGKRPKLLESGSGEGFLGSQPEGKSYL